MVDRNHRLIHDYFLEGAHAMYCDQKVHAGRFLPIIRLSRQKHKPCFMFHGYCMDIYIWSISGTLL